MFNIFKVSKVESSRGEEDNNLHEADLANKTIPRFGVVCDRMKYRVAYFPCRLGRPASSSEGVAQLTLLPLFGKPMRWGLFSREKIRKNRSA